MDFSVIGVAVLDCITLKCVSNILVYLVYVDQGWKTDDLSIFLGKIKRMHREKFVF